MTGDEIRVVVVDAEDENNVVARLRGTPEWIARKVERGEIRATDDPKVFVQDVGATATARRPRKLTAAEKRAAARREERSDAATAAKEKDAAPAAPEQGETNMPAATKKATAAKAAAPKKATGPAKAAAPKVEEKAKPAPAPPKDGFVAEIPTKREIVFDAVDAALGRMAKGRKTRRVDDWLVVLDSEAQDAVNAITDHMRAIVAEDRSANMYREGKLRGVRSAILAAGPKHLQVQTVARKKAEPAPVKAAAKKAPAAKKATASKAAAPKPEVKPADPPKVEEVPAAPAVIETTATEPKPETVKPVEVTPMFKKEGGRKAS